MLFSQFLALSANHATVNLREPLDLGAVVGGLMVSGLGS